MDFEIREDRWFYRLFYAAGGVLLFLLLVSSWLNERDAQINDRLSSGFEVKGLLTQLQLSVQDGESAVLGYVLNDADRYLEQYQQSKLQRDLALAALRTITQSDLKLGMRVLQLDSLLQAKYQELENELKLVQQGRREMAGQQIATRLGHMVRGEIRSQVAELMAEQDRELLRCQQLMRSFSFWHQVLALVQMAMILLMSVLVLAAVRVRQRVLKERREMQHQMQVAQKMESLGQLTAGIAHDFNNILAGVNGFAQLAQRRFASLDEGGELAEYLREIVQGGQRAQSLVAQLLAYGRNKGSTGSRLDMKVELAMTMGLLRAMVPSTIALSFRQPEESLWVMAQSSELQQCVVNLVVNAREAIGDRHGEIELLLARRRVSGLHCAACSSMIEGDFVALQVGDDGRGLETEMPSQVFEPFYTTKSLAEGSGMGLAVVYGVVHAAGGHILLESTPGQGTVVTLLLPAVSGHN